MAGALGRRVVFPGEKRGAEVGIGRKGKGTNLYVLTDGHNLPLGVHLAGTDRYESTQVIPLIDRAVIRWGCWPRSVRLLYDRATDSDPLRKRLRSRCIRLFCPTWGNRKVKKPLTVSQRRWYSHRWQIERNISWLQNYRRLIVRYEYHPTCSWEWPNSPACSL